MPDILKTIAFQVTDQEFLTQYEERIRQSGLKVKDYLINLIKADITQSELEEQAANAQDNKETSTQDAENTNQEDHAQAEQTTETEPAHGADISDQPDGSQAEQDAEEASASPINNSYIELLREHIRNQMDVGYISETEKEILFANIEKMNTEMLEIAGEYDNGIPLDAETDAIDKLIQDTIKHHSSIQENASGYTDQPDNPQAAQTANAIPAQNTEEAPSQSTDITNLFVKITKDQREAIDARKVETGENVGALLNRLIDDFLENVRNGDFPEDFDGTYDYYASISSTCNTTCSAKILTQTNQELAGYLEQTGKSRNVLMSCLVHMDLHSQDMAEEQGQGMSM